jgi:Zn-dependent protease
MAEQLGDSTARYAGRLTLNPKSHIDLWGTILMPLFLFISTGGSFMFAYAKPVPYNPYNLKNKRSGEFLIALAGPVSNLAIALIFGFLIRFIQQGTMTPVIEISAYIVLVNIVLAVFNLIPIPPLDGSKLLFSLLPNQYGRLRMQLESFAPILIVVVAFFLWRFISPVIWPIFEAFTGIGFGG